MPKTESRLATGTKWGKKPCVRCGYRYEPRNGVPGLCPSCRLTVPAEEHPRWA